MAATTAATVGSFPAPVVGQSAVLDASFFPFALPLNTAENSSIDLRSMNDAPAGSKGRVISKDGHFFRTGDNQRIRFWAINIGGPELFASSRQDITLVAQRLAKNGYNLVRLHHLDNSWDVARGRSLWNKDSPKRVIDANNLDLLHFAIAEFKKVGIYVNLNTKVSKELTAADGLPGNFNTQGDWDAGFPHQKRVDRFSRFFIDHQKQFARDLWASNNPYTGMRLADDPVIAFAEINNENSLLSLWPGQPLGVGLDKLPPYFVNELTTLWNTWLKKKYGSQDDLMKAWGQPKLGLGAPVTGPNTGWIQVFPGASEGNLQLVGGEKEGVLPSAKFVVSKTTGTDWHQQGIVPNIVLQNDQIYTLKFTASSDPARDLRISVDLSSGDFRNVGLNQTVKLTPTPQAFELIFTANNPAQSQGNRIAVQVGAITGTVDVEGLVLQPGISKSMLDASQTVEKGNVGINPSMSRAMRNDWLGFLAEADRSYSVEMRKLFRDEIGVKSLLADTQVEWGGTTGFNREQDSDFIDTHGYYNHPQFGTKAWNPVNWTVARSSLLVNMAKGDSGTLGNIASYRVAGKPFTLSEYDHPAPNDYRVEMYPITSTVASLQDWDAVYVFAHGNWTDEGNVGKINRFFDNGFDPAKFCFAPAAAIIFRNNLIPELRQTQTLTLTLQARPWEAASSVGAIWGEQLNAKINPLGARYSVVIGDGPSNSVMPNISVPADPQRVRIQTRPAGPVFIAANENALVFTGFIGGQTFDTPAGKVVIDTFGGNFGSFMLVPMDQQPLETSKRMLLTIMSRAENTGMVWNADRTSVGNQWGTPPSMVETFGGSITFNAPAKSVVPIRPDGSRGTSMKADGDVKFSPADKTVWYEIVRD